MPIVERMRTRIVTLTALAVLVLAACSGPAAEQPEPANDVLAAHGLDGTPVRDLIDDLDRTPLAERSAGFMASVRPGELLISDATTTEQVSLPIADGFYLSVAPYIDTTHECYFHSLTTCKGELGGEEVRIIVTNAETGEVIVDEQTTTFDNGFIAVWLPRDISAMLRVEHDGLAAEAPIATGPDDATCITTLQLA
ncbi:MAG: hypothetical protein CVT64_10340 [Actinobacteria bacterium HGW-Actinobacteria-4]|nr:MAG: hypothetical protein CVT64_10340 [Actinobacteria bacterium HGW-Actinobacteria-4]